MVPFLEAGGEQPCLLGPLCGGNNTGKDFPFLSLLVSLESPVVLPEKNDTWLSHCCHSHLLLSIVSLLWLYKVPMFYIFPKLVFISYEVYVFVICPDSRVSLLRYGFILSLISCYFHFQWRLLLVGRFSFKMLPDWSKRGQTKSCRRGVTRILLPEPCLWSEGRFWDLCSDLHRI